MRRLQLFRATAALLVTASAASACANSADPQQAAQAASEATLSCRYLLVLGKTIQDGTAVLSRTADDVLGQADAQASMAATTDSRWHSFATDVHTVRTDLETGNRRTLASHLSNVGSRCAQLVTPSTAPAPSN